MPQKPKPFVGERIYGMDDLNHVIANLQKRQVSRDRSMAAFILGSLPKKPAKRWTGWLGSDHLWRGRRVILPDGRVGYVVGAVRGEVIVRVDAAFSIQGFTDAIYPAEDLRMFKMPAAVELGRGKRGVRERPSALKAMTSRLNGSMPPRPGSRRRGRPWRGGQD